MAGKKPVGRSVGQAQISAFRLRRHHLLERGNAPLTTICGDVCGIQAQVMSAAEMALWVRRPGLTRKEIHAALFQERMLVKTSLMRQTLHLIPAADFSLYMSALKRSHQEAVLGVMARFGIKREDETALAESELGERVVRLLQSFDAFLLGHAEKGHLVDGAVYKRVYRNQGWISPVLLVEGRVVGVWSRTRCANALILDVELFEKTAKAPRAALAEAAASLGAFLGAPCQLKIAQ